MSESVVALGDIHFPWANRKSLNKALEFIKVHKPTYVVQMGDLYDMLSQSRYPGFHHTTAKQEILQARKQAEKFWQDVKRASPKSELYQLVGNHDERPIKKLKQVAPELEVFVDVISFLRFPGVQTQPAESAELILRVNGERIVFMHGYRARHRLGNHAIHNFMSTVRAHSHRGGCETVRIGNKTYWELDCGFLGADGRNCNVSYRRQQRVSTWTQGLGYIDQYGARFVAFPNK